jgi:hypothetical protein
MNPAGRHTRDEFLAELKRMREAVGVSRGGLAAAEAISLRLPSDRVTPFELIDAIGRVDLSRLLDAGFQLAAAWDLDHTIFTGMSPQLIAPVLVRLNPFRQSANAGLVAAMLRTSQAWGSTREQLLDRPVADNLALVLERERTRDVTPLQRNELVARSLQGLTRPELAAIGDRFYNDGVPGVERPYRDNLLGREGGTPRDVMKALEGKGISSIILQRRPRLPC